MEPSYPPERQNVVVVGAGPGGLMAAETAARNGHAVRVFDHRRSPGRRLVLAGRGGLNLTHSEPLDEFLKRYGPERTHLERAIRDFDPDALRAWADGLSEPTFIGSSGRVFPESFRAVPLLRAWLRRLRAHGVTFHGEHSWTGWDESGDVPGMTFTDATGAGVRVDYDSAVLALGGPSWPRVGSNGSWVEILRSRGIDIEAFSAANCGVSVRWSAPHIDRFAGSPIKNAAVIVEGVAVRGDPVVTRSGLEGGPVYAHGRRLRTAIETNGSVDLTIDLMPDLDIGDLVRRLAERKQKKKSLSTWLKRCGLSAVGISLMREATNNQLPTTADDLGELAKTVTFRVDELASIDRAISCAGGVRWSEVTSTLQLVDAPRTWVVGEMLDWEAPTGGYLLQAAFSTGRLAGVALSQR